MSMRIAALLLLGYACLAGASKPANELDVSTFPLAMKSEVEEIAVVYRQFPSEPSVLYQVAALHARAGHKRQAIQVLRKMAFLGAGIDPRTTNFASLAEDKDFKQLKAQIEAVKEGCVRKDRAEL